MISKQKLFVSGLAVLSSACFSIYYGSMKWLHMKQEFLFSPKIKDQQSVRILHISDLHANSNKQKNLDIWKRIDKSAFDMVVITGDVVTSWLDEIHSHLQEIKKLAQQYPVFYVEGNHETFFAEDLADILTDAGVHVLYNQQEAIEINNNKINIIGVRDFYHLRANRFNSLDSLFQSMEKETFTLVLSHQPQIFDRIKQYAPDLVLCGHTHGGQVRLPFFPTLFAPGQGLFPKYGQGWYSHGQSKMYISKGVGTTIFPIRFFNRPEIAIVHLCSEPISSSS